MRRYFTFFWFLILIPALYFSKRIKTYPKVAVCITGQVQKWIPEFQIPNLIEFNRNTMFSFFFNLQFSQKYFNAQGIKDVTPSNWTRIEFRRAFNLISEMYSSNHSDVVTFKFDLPYDLRKWQILLDQVGKPLDRISNHVKTQHFVLNTYQNQLSCIEEILEYENQTQIKFDYIITTKEDAFYFHPISLMDSYIMLKDDNCGVITKSCCAQGGINTRFQIARRDEGVRLFSSRIDFYQSLFEKNIKISSPEMFELLQLTSYGFRNCTLPVDTIPITSAKINSTNQVCLMEKEIQSDDAHSDFSCIPKRFFDKMKALTCAKYKVKIPLPTVRGRDRYKDYHINDHVPIIHVAGGADAGSTHSLHKGNATNQHHSTHHNHHHAHKDKAKLPTTTTA
jgi:hypothetical protein